MRHRSLPALLLSLCLVLAAPLWASADCAPAGPADLIEQAEIIALGRVGRVDSLTDSLRYTVVLSQVYKGDPPNPVKLRLPASDPLAAQPAQVGDEWLFYLAPATGGTWQFDRCSGSHPGGPVDAEAALLGAGGPARLVGLPERAWIPITAVSLTVAAMALVLLSIWRQRVR